MLVMGTCCSSKTDIIASTQPETNMRLIKKKSMRNTDGNADSASSSDEETYREFDTALAQSGEDSDVSDDIPMSKEDKQVILNGFMNAIQKSNDSLVKYYLNEHPSLNLLKTRFENNDTCLHVAVKKKAFQIIKFLLTQDESIISPNFQNDDGDTSLHTAAYSREVYSVQLLLNSNKADAEVSNHNKETALQIAIANKDIDIIKLLTPAVYENENNTNDKNEIWKSASFHSFASRDRSYNANPQIGQNLSCEDVDNETERILNDDLDWYGSNDENNEKNNGVNGGQSPLLTMEDEQRKRLKAIQISRNNPFTKLSKTSSKRKLMDVKDNAQTLPKLSAWLEIKSVKPPYSWVKRWVIVEDTYFLWCAKQKIIKNVNSAKERDKFRGHFKLMNIKKIEKLKDKNGRKFMIVQEEGSQKKKKEFKFRAASRGDCDHWCNGLQIHIDHLKTMLKYLGTKSPHSP